MFSTLQNYVKSWHKEELVFSYGLTCSVTPGGLTLTLQQKQTEFSLTITIQPSPDSLRVSSFTVAEDPRLGDLCQPLYDAALIEMVIQGLTLIVFCAHCLNKEDVNFMISLKDAAHLTAFENLFNCVSSHTTNQGKRQLLTLSVWPPYSEGICENIEIMKIQLHQKLWASQKSDKFLREYLQGSETSLLSLLLIQKKEAHSEERGNVILFPLTSSQRTAIRSI
ncbi:hypothetical protein [Candidatus Odyssella acanthamoebae]|uniref:Uncharacterized protein n=1 Tax=Candidatus Odyssella acanthamoebae TaxID=91604 RepID=A0A077AX14_9PROT|nr:hypothetical protein [Candidatus Paracaedibacter acanthamoebae]AIK96519.1 hypothetical protein ID47_06835 [Candidatus Paracaedibacter acanthamoebae]